MPSSARRPDTTVLVPVGSTRTMNQMGHEAANLVGIDASGIDAKLGRVVPGYMTMGETGMGDMMQMAQPQNSISMTGGKGPYGDIDMGGMFTLLKVRDRLSGVRAGTSRQRLPARRPPTR